MRREAWLIGGGNVFFFFLSGCMKLYDRKGSKLNRAVCITCKVCVCVDSVYGNHDSISAFSNYARCLFAGAIQPATASKALFFRSLRTSKPPEIHFPLRSSRSDVKSSSCSKSLPTLKITHKDPYHPRFPSRSRSRSSHPYPDHSHYFHPHHHPDDSAAPQPAHHP